MVSKQNCSCVRASKGSPATVAPRRSVDSTSGGYTKNLCFRCVNTKSWKISKDEEHLLRFQITKSMNNIRCEVDISRDTERCNPTATRFLLAKQPAIGAHTPWHATAHKRAVTVGHANEEQRCNLYKHSEKMTHLAFRPGLHSKVAFHSTTLDHFVHSTRAVNTGPRRMRRGGGGLINCASSKRYQKRSLLSPATILFKKYSVVVKMYPTIYVKKLAL